MLVLIPKLVTFYTLVKNFYTSGISAVLCWSLLRDLKHWLLRGHLLYFYYCTFLAELFKCKWYMDKCLIAMEELRGD